MYACIHKLACLLAHFFPLLVVSFLEPSSTFPHDAAHKFPEELPVKQGFCADLSDSNILDLMKSNGLDVST